MPESYIEKCIQALPPEKQAAARAAFKDIAEGGDDSVFSKVLVTLEATSAYAGSLPQAVAASGEHFLREFDARLQAIAAQRTSADEQRDEVLREFLRQQVAALGQTLGGGDFSAEMKAQTAELGRIKSNLSRLRHVRFGGLLFLMLIGAALGGGGHWYFQRSHDEKAQRAAQKLAALESAGIVWDYRATEQGAQMRIEGPRIAADGVTWRRNAAGQTVGVNILFTSGGVR